MSVGLLASPSGDQRRPPFWWIVRKLKDDYEFKGLWWSSVKNKSLVFYWNSLASAGQLMHLYVDDRSLHTFCFRVCLQHFLDDLSVVDRLCFNSSWHDWVLNSQCSIQELVINCQFPSAILLKFLAYSFIPSFDSFRALILAPLQDINSEALPAQLWR